LKCQGSAIIATFSRLLFPFPSQQCHTSFHLHENGALQGLNLRVTVLEIAINRMPNALGRSVSTSLHVDVVNYYRVSAVNPICVRLRNGTRAQEHVSLPGSEATGATSKAVATVYGGLSCEQNLVSPQ
jgi:hypothetical protein